jgi:hypothetical protein
MRSKAGSEVQGTLAECTAETTSSGEASLSSKTVAIQDNSSNTVAIQDNGINTVAMQ